MRVVRISSPSENYDEPQDDVTRTETEQGRTSGVIRSFRVIRNKRIREPRISVPQEEVEWRTGLRVYEEDSFERLRMPRSPQWSIVWSDLMMTMFILFVVLYVYHSLHKETVKETVLVKVPTIDISAGSKIEDGGPVEPFSESSDSRQAIIYDLSRQVDDEESIQNIARVDLAPDKTVRVILTADLLFDSGSAEIKEGALLGLRKIIPLFSQTQDMINVAGHTDDLPIRTKEFPSNWELSLVRASRIAHFLMQEGQLAENRFYVSGYGATQPVAPNDTPEHRAENRRVEIILTKEKPSAITKMEGNL